jgi:hypothetical protein
VNDNRVNCWNPLKTMHHNVTSNCERDGLKSHRMHQWEISSQVAERSVEGPTTRSWSLDVETVKTHECAAPHEGEDIVWTTGKPVEAGRKLISDNNLDKPQFVAPCWYFPAGGGIYGLDATTAVFNNGMPTQQSIMKLARPIVLPVRQNFNVNAEFFAVGATVALTLLNTGAADDQKVILFMIDGQDSHCEALAA